MMITNIGLWGQHKEGFLCWGCESREWKGEPWKWEDWETEGIRACSSHSCTAVPLPDQMFFSGFPIWFNKNRFLNIRQCSHLLAEMFSWQFHSLISLKETCSQCLISVRGNHLFFALYHPRLDDGRLLPCTSTAHDHDESHPGHGFRPHLPNVLETGWSLGQNNNTNTL